MMKPFNNLVAFVVLSTLGNATAFEQLSFSSPAASQLSGSEIIIRDLADFDWEITPLDGYPIIAFNTTEGNDELVFRYNYTGDLVEGEKQLTARLLLPDCINDGDTSVVRSPPSALSNNEYEVGVDIVKDTISGSSFYSSLNDTAASISFCLRVDYELVAGNDQESVNFHETVVTVTVDLTADFRLSAIDITREGAANATETASLDYPVNAYFCNDGDVQVPGQLLSQGSALQFCVKIDDSVLDAVFVEDILEATISQPNANGRIGASASNIITGTVADSLTEKACRELGICNVKSQLLSKFFADADPLDLEVTGTALLSFGSASMMPSSSPVADTRRRLRVPITATINSKELKAIIDAQAGEATGSHFARSNNVASLGRGLQDDSAQSEFGLIVGLVNEDAGPSDTIENDGGIDVIVIVGIVLVISLLSGCCLFFFCFTKKRNDKEEKVDEKTVIQYDMEENKRDDQKHLSSNRGSTGASRGTPYRPGN
jgi:hypothetical protein